jgi:hypothetical protein
MENMGQHKMGQHPDTNLPMTNGMMQQQAIIRKRRMGMMMKQGIIAKKMMMGMGMRQGILNNLWSLIKKSNGQCECVQAPQGQIVVGRFRSRNECETARGHGC